MKIFFRSMLRAGLVVIVILLFMALAETLRTSRGLADQEIETLQKIFSDQVDYQRIVISTLPLPASVGAFVIGDHIFYEKNYHRPDFAPDVMKMALLVHEVAHVWANQRHGFWTTLAAVLEHGSLGEQVYAIGDLDSTRSLESYRLEQQARILSQYFINLHYGFDREPFESIIHRSLPVEHQLSNESSNL